MAYRGRDLAKENEKWTAVLDVNLRLQEQDTYLHLLVTGDVWLSARQNMPPGSKRLRAVVSWGLTHTGLSELSRRGKTTQDIPSP
jgi:hypothetical protein